MTSALTAPAAQNTSKTRSYRCVAIAGVAAAFRAPVGGVLFALEEMTSWFRNQLLWYAFFTTAVVSVAGEACLLVVSHGSPSEESGSLACMGICPLRLSAPECLPN